MADFAPLTMPEWFLVIVLAAHTNGLVPVDQHFGTRDRCEQQLAVEVTVHRLRRQEVVYAACERIRRPRERAAR